MANGTLAASQIEMLSLSGTGIITITPPATNTNRAITLPDAAGALVVSGTTPSLNGITFPATQSASADANTLDDYEEGTWTPTIIGDGTAGTASYGTRTGSYVKVGQLVQYNLYLDYSSGTGSGNLQISGLPFNTNNNTTFPAVSIGYLENIALTANATPLGLTTNNNNKIYFYQVPSGGGVNVQIPYDSAGSIIITGTYKTTA